jgi:membrane associated rhomboid family serine protease
MLQRTKGSDGRRMGIYDRDYYRNDATTFARWVNPHRVCHWLIAINVFVFVMQMTTRNGGVSPLMDYFSLKPEKVIHGEVWRLLTCAFLHSEADIWHIVMNMLVLWWFGSEVEEIYGPKEFLATYLVAAVFSSLAFVGYEYAVHPDHPAYAVGASGAITTMMVIFALHFPTRTLLLMMIIPVPALLLVGLYIAFDIFRMLGAHGGDHIAFAAHLGGALFGYLYYRFHWRVLNWWPSRMSMKPRRFSGPRLRVYREPSESDVALLDAPSDSEQLEAQLDTVLEKVARYGQASLTAREQQILMKASEVYKQRRK